MRKFELPQPKNEDLAQEIERHLRELGLEVREMGGLRAYPGSCHWHAKLPGQRGVLEVTWWPNRELWASVQGGRDAPWIDAYVEDLRRLLVTLQG